MFKRQHKVRFSDTDYAGIIFFPRYFEMLSAVIEDWFESEIGASFPKMLDEIRIGSPLGHVEVKFVSPCRLGEVLDFTLTVKSVSEKTVTLEVNALHDGILRVGAIATHICVHRDISGAREWPAEISSKIREFCEKSATDS